MDTLVYFVASALVRLIQALPLRWAARLGRAGGVMAWVLDGRHRKVAIRNLTQCFGREMSPDQIKAIARENFKRIGECYCCAVRTAAMPWEDLSAHVEVIGPAWVHDTNPAQPPLSKVGAIGHFGNFEICARLGNYNPTYRGATTYRGLQPASLNKVYQSLREMSGCLYFERRTEAAALKAWMAPHGQVIGFLADQHAGRSGVRVPFFGADCATTTAPAVFALRYNQPLFVLICYRTSLARWRLEFSDFIPTHEGGQARRVEAIIEDINRTFEAAVRRDPANWFWVHNRWKPDKLPPARSRQRKPETTVPADH